MMKSAPAAILISGVLMSGFALGIMTGSSLRVAPTGQITCLGTTIDVQNVTFNNVAYAQRDVGDLIAAISEAVCKRNTRSIHFRVIGGAS